MLSCPTYAVFLHKWIGSSCAIETPWFSDLFSVCTTCTHDRFEWLGFSLLFTFTHPPTHSSSWPEESLSKNNLSAYSKRLCAFNNNKTKNKKGSFFFFSPSHQLQTQSYNKNNLFHPYNNIKQNKTKSKIIMNTNKGKREKKK
ncbi:hypothetical protein BDF14DRAFT_934357 [Spinellus fusiger]|nr:hypothetical protein BDF14DRAFT_934357 [Spinellus fusiger]